MSIAIVTVAYGDLYRDFLPEWCEAINQLTISPDEIIIITDSIADASSKTSTLLHDYRIMRAEGGHTHHPQVYVNQAIAKTSSEWIIKMDVDDLIRPDALANWPEADIIMFGIAHRGGELHHPPITAEQILAAGYNPVFSGSAFKRSLWEQNPFMDIIFEDWAFWRGCARQGAHFAPLGRVGYIYREHDQQISRQANDAHWTRIVLEQT